MWTFFEPLYMDNNRGTCHTYFLSLTHILRQPLLIESIINILPELLKLVGSLGLLVAWQVRFQKCVMLQCQPPALLVLIFGLCPGLPFFFGSGCGRHWHGGEVLVGTQPVEIFGSRTCESRVFPN